ncbi:hypothetical protein K493DRAFT_363673 [Basidiobolus meristosporus CBS 931.73]|uniref:Uncharacterized protein n=1 Tax=Basidiobolus meristosporus CBS 931.73 TaxID=1314790 RepID=A0A1Y1WSS6_9FUNG|nr:hypothetical protein K493DRAFT_363673 [Basidiobolus meristosporus CBS 931.73]|eukprot:ORX76583.1 hypothetical protein K493DRAFT_363673 [Basidiobolus meristosporus CBS 931.73]
MISMLASSYAEPLDRNQPIITVTPEYVKLCKNGKIVPTLSIHGRHSVPVQKESTFGNTSQRHTPEEQGHFTFELVGSYLEMSVSPI